MIPRYSPPEMARLFSEEARLGMWLEVEVLAAEGWAKAGALPAEDAAALREKAPFASRGPLPAVSAALVAAVQQREAVTGHDTAAFVDVVQDAVGPPAAAWVHYGLTSSDVVDTALAAILVRAADLLIEASSRLVGALKHRARELAGVAIAGRTHGVHAEPTTMGAKLALWCLQADRDRERFRRARAAIGVGKLSGAVGTYSNIDPAVEAYVCGALGLRPAPATQVTSRDRHAEYLWACASAGAGVELFATEIRHLARTEVGEVAEPFGVGQKGSSAMPHKRNPVRSERLSGLARVLRGHLGAGLEDVALWHERDISHSSVERIVLPDASLLAYFMLTEIADLVENMVVDPARMLDNLQSSHGLVFSQPILLALVASGTDRDAAYRTVQRAARRAVEECRAFRSCLEEDPEVKLGAEQLDEAFSLERALRHASRAVEALDDVEA